MKTLLHLLPFALLASCATTTAPTQEQRFNQADANGDGLVDRQEATNFIIAEAFGIYDTNDDEIVDESEFVAGGGDVTKYRKAVEPGSKGLTLEQVQNNPEAVDRFAVSFDEADTDKTGTVSYQEYLDYIQRLEAAVR